jgi:pyruvyl transferase EpsO
MTGPDSQLLNNLRHTLHEVLCTLGPFERPVVLLDFPNHGNVGDSAIWLGELAWLDSCGLTPSLVCTLLNYSEPAVRRQLAKAGTIFLHGGGNLGDLWPTHQTFRERVLDEFPDRRVVQLPQSIFFRSAAALQSARAAFRRHTRFTLLARETPSFAFAEREFEIDVRLCPDMAFALAPLRRRRPATEVVVLARTDHESAGSASRASAETVDWLEDTASIAIELERKYRYSNRLAWMRRRLYERLARERVRRGCDILGRGRTVVTDRLHAHILCLLMSIPHVLLDNSYGKLSAFYNTWTRSSRLAAFETDFEQAIVKVRSLS